MPACAYVRAELPVTPGSWQARGGDRPSSTMLSGVPCLPNDPTCGAFGDVLEWARPPRSRARALADAAERCRQRDTRGRMNARLFWGLPGGCCLADVPAG